MNDLPGVTSGGSLYPPRVAPALSQTPDLFVLGSAATTGLCLFNTGNCSCISTVNKFRRQEKV